MRAAMLLCARHAALLVGDRRRCCCCCYVVLDGMLEMFCCCYAVEPRILHGRARNACREIQKQVFTMS